MRTLVSFCAAVFLLLGCSGGKSSGRKDPVVITYVGSSAPGFAFDDDTIQRFTRQTGIEVRFIPAPELISDQLLHYQKLLEDNASTPDVYFVDVVWPGILGEQLQDLTADFRNEAHEFFPALIENDTVNGKLVAIPSMTEVGLLYYRKDLLEKYGFSGPPSTWDELEQMARKIQVGERRSGNRNFWGYVWQGAPSEGLTCIALEWQASQGGGVIIDKQTRSITVDNPHAARAIARAAKWIGNITPEAVLSYGEEDAVNVWLAGDAAFFRGWSLASRRSSEPGVFVRNRFSIAAIPGGKGVQGGTLGGWQLAVSPYSAHKPEAIQFIRYVTGSEVQIHRALTGLLMPTRPRLYMQPEMVALTGRYPPVIAAKEGAAVMRPSAVAGSKYQQVSAAYYTAVHRILKGDVKAEAGLRELSKQLAQITGFPENARTVSD
jgi:trehalose/maltose transport system substrate-binding protein